MIRLILLIAFLAAAAFGFGWLADNPGTLSIDWFGTRIETSTLVAVLSLAGFAILSVVVWAIVQFAVHGPGAVSLFMRTRRTERGHRAVARGLVAVGAGDTRTALRAALDAENALGGNAPVALLLRSQAAQLAGDKDQARKTFQRMLESPETRALGLRGLYVEASRAGDREAARQFALEASKTQPGLTWAGSAVLDDQARAGDWDAVIDTLARNADAKVIDRATSKRLRAVVRTAQAIERAESDPATAKAMALEAHGLAPDLVPAAAIAARLSAAAGDAKRASRILETTWKISQHPDLAAVYLKVRSGDMAKDRLKRAKALADVVPNSLEGTLTTAAAALEAREFELARSLLTGIAAGTPTERVCLLMAALADAEDKVGEVREWTARAVHAPRDPAWCADGYVSDRWMPVSPVTGKLDAFVWKVPVEAAPGSELPVITLPVVPPAPEGTPQVAPPRPAPVVPPVIEAEPAPAPADPPAAVPPAINGAHPPDDPGPEGTPPPKRKGFSFFSARR